MKVIIVGAGLSGLTAAASMRMRGHQVTIFDVRTHLGGNCADMPCGDGTRAHLHGPHIFHTENERVWGFLNKFSSFNSYQHRVMACTQRGVIPIPFNDISKQLIGNLTDDGIRELLFTQYSEKMWGVPWTQLPDSVTKRVALRREGVDCRYFTDKHQGIPTDGYDPMFNAMAEGCDVHLGCSVDAWRRHRYDLLVYTGALDEFYSCCFGRLPYRTLDIRMRPRMRDEEFPASVINQCNNLPFTRKADHSWWHGHEGHGDGVITVEHPRDCEPDDIPYYPIPFGHGLDLASRYFDLYPGANVVLLGRLAMYRYMNMDQSVLQSLEALDQFS